MEKKNFKRRFSRIQDGETKDTKGQQKNNILIAKASLTTYIYYNYSKKKLLTEFL